MQSFKPFSNDGQAISIGDLDVENNVDRLNFYGSLQITRDQRGLEVALALKQLADSIVDQLASTSLPCNITLVEPVEEENPFGNIGRAAE